jgi:RNA polymerase sigma-70 factor, ECF subfamily
MASAMAAMANSGWHGLAAPARSGSIFGEGGRVASSPEPSSLLRTVAGSDAVRRDGVLVERCLKGEDPAWEELVRVHTPRVYGICYRFTGSSSEAQDIAQDVFIRVFQSLRTFRSGEGSFAVWLTRLTRNLLIDNYRRTKNLRKTDSMEEQLTQMEGKASAETRTDGRLMSREASEILQLALQKLSPELREAVVLRDLQEMEYREIAQALAIPEGTVKSRINRGRVELAQVLRRANVVI